MMQGKTIRTPPLVGTILPGVTRKSILQIAADRGYTVTEENIPISEALEADEVFTSGVPLGMALAWRFTLGLSEMSPNCIVRA